MDSFRYDEEKGLCMFVQESAGEMEDRDEEDDEDIVKGDKANMEG
jgi:hypothetical protein